MSFESGRGEVKVLREEPSRSAASLVFLASVFFFFFFPFFSFLSPQFFITRGNYERRARAHIMSRRLSSARRKVRSISFKVAPCTMNTAPGEKRRILRGEFADFPRIYSTAGSRADLSLANG